MPDISTITVIQDNRTKNKSYIDLIKRYYEVRICEIGSFHINDIISSDLIIVQVDLYDQSSIQGLKEILVTPHPHKIPTLFLLKEFSRREVVQANTMGATDYIIYPCPDSNFIQIVDDLVNDDAKQAWTRLSPTQEEALKVSLKVVEKTFHNASQGLEVSQKEVKENCALIIEATAKDGLTDWMNAIRQHHSSTYRHSMMVCGYLVSFGMLLGFKKSDLQTLAVGGMLHDIGKAKIPLSILDKNSDLTVEEEEIVNLHPLDGRRILLKDKWDDVTIDIATHHHENLDGSGYPNGLKGNEISDIVRVATIANVFSGLTDKRSFKPVMTAEKAIEKMTLMTDHLDIALVNSFRAVVLSDDNKVFAHQK